MRLPILGLVFVALFQGLDARAQWSFDKTNWSARAARTELWQALEERHEGYGYMNLSASVPEPGWWSGRYWIEDFDLHLKTMAEKYVDQRYVTNNTLDGYFAADTSRNAVPYWSFSNLLVSIGATNRPKTGSGEPQFSNYTTNGNVRWVGASNFQFFQERRDALNKLLITLPNRYQWDYVEDFRRAGYGNGSNVAAAQAACEADFSADTNLTGMGWSEVDSSFHTNIGGAEAWMELRGGKVEVEHDPSTTQFSSRVIVYFNDTWSTGTFAEWSDNGLNFTEGSLGQSKWTNSYSAGSAGVYTSDWMIADSTTPLEWFGGALDTNSPSSDHARGMYVNPTFITFDYSVSNGFKFK